MAGTPPGLSVSRRTTRTGCSTSPVPRNVALNSPRPCVTSNIRLLPGAAYMLPGSEDEGSVIPREFSVKSWHVYHTECVVGVTPGATLPA